MRFKASPYRHPMTGQLRPGKTHGLRPNGNSTTLCGLTVAKVPGNLLEDNRGDVDCQICLKAAARQHQPSHSGELSSKEGDEHPTFGKYAAEVARNCLTSIAHSSVVFAWLDDPSAYGSLAELGYAHALKTPIWLAWPKPLKDLWFVQEMASAMIVAETATIAFRELLRTQKGSINA
jgi:nucleoside 2-deoxyribosyltransferase